MLIELHDATNPQFPLLSQNINLQTKQMQCQRACLFTMFDGEGDRQKFQYTLWNHVDSLLMVFVYVWVCAVHVCVQQQQGTKENRKW